jgi:hypothetical protein
VSWQERSAAVTVPNKTLLVPSEPELLGFYRKVDEIQYCYPVGDCI